MRPYMYNPQIVLNLLMKNYGRSMHCSKSDGVSKMSETLADNLHINRESARHQVEILVGSGLLDFDSNEFAVGTWHIGPTAEHKV